MAAPTEDKNTQNSTNDGEIDKELNELLDDALGDFDKPGVGKQTSGAGAEGGKPLETHSSAGDPISDAFAEQFSDELSKEFEDAMKSFLSDDPAMMQQIEKLAEAAGAAGDSAEGQKEFGETLKQTLNSLAQNTEGLQDQGGMDEDMMKMFSGMGLESAGQDEGFMPMMQNMMKTLLSKEVLYPSLKEISEKYPKWLTDNQGKISEKEHSNYTKQNEIIGDILVEFEKEKATDSEAVKKQRFEKIMDMMQRMQDLGQPPKEIVGDMAPGLDFDANGVPKFPGTSDACSVM